MPGAHQGQKRVSDPLELTLWMLFAVMWVLGLESGSTASVLNHWAISPGPFVVFMRQDFAM
ncbi:hypothetical protein ACQP3L_35085, partial [Escherichia coli]